MKFLKRIKFNLGLTDPEREEEEMTERMVKEDEVVEVEEEVVHHLSQARLVPCLMFLVCLRTFLGISELRHSQEWKDFCLLQE